MGFGGIGITIFAIVWTVFISLFDCAVGWSLFQQWQSVDFVAATGHVDESEVTVSRGKRTSYGVRIRYTYRVDGATYRASRYRYAGTPSDSRESHQVVARYPTGKEIEVFYDPANPSRAVLSNSFGAADLFTVFFLVPFNCVAIGLCLPILGWLRFKLFKPPAGGVRIVDDGHETRARIGGFPPTVAALGAIGLASFISIFVLGFGFSGELTATVLGVTFGIVLAAGVLAAVWVCYRAASGRSDLTIDNLKRKLTLPVCCGRKNQVVLDLGNVKRVAVVRVKRRSSKGGYSYTYRPALVLQDGRVDDLAEFYMQWKARAFGDWLIERLHLQAAHEASSPVGAEEGNRTIIA